MKITARMIEALKILEHYDASHGKAAADFAREFWPDHLMHIQVVNQGNGACAGKKAWLQAGSYLGKLSNEGLVGKTRRGHFFIRSQGKEILKKYANKEL